MRIGTSACPACGATPDHLSIDEILDCTPPGSWSLAGVQAKRPARPRPRLRCAGCGLDRIGKYDGRHAVFPSDPT
jgi:hypothetical protein